MEQDWNSRVAARIGQRVAYFRERIGRKGSRLTAQALADRCVELGHPLDRSVIAKLEKGHRQTVTVADLLVLAKALGVPATELIMPLGQEQESEILPGQTRPTWAATKWIRGEAAFPRADLRATAQPLIGTEEDNEAWIQGSEATQLHLEHDRILLALEWQSERIPILQEAVAEAAAEDSLRRREHLADVERRIGELQRQLAHHRRTMRNAGIEPPLLPAELRQLDDRHFVFLDQDQARGHRPVDWTPRTNPDREGGRR